MVCSCLVEYKGRQGEKKGGGGVCGIGINWTARHTSRHKQGPIHINTQDHIHKTKL